MILALIGLFIVLYIAYVMYFIVIKPSLGGNVDVTKMGKWAVVTGATDGIGKAFAKELAKKGLNIVLISRTPSRLQAVAEEIESKFKVTTKTVAVDFTGGYEVYAPVRDALQGLEIGVLVNNVGMSYEHPQYFLDIENRDKFFLDMIHCNIYSMTFMTSIVLPQMVEKQKGVIINNSSLLGVSPSPLVSIYGACKGYVDKLSRDLQMEYGDKGIIIESIVPGYVVSKISKISKPSLIAPTPEVYVKSCMQTLGVSDRTAAYLPHRIWLHATDVLAFYFPSFASKTVMNSLKGIRAKALKKKAKSN